MKKAGLHATLQLSMKEYIETISGLVLEHYQRAVSDEALFRELSMTPKEEARFSVEYSTVLLVIAALSFKQKPKMTSEKYLREIQDGAAKSTYQKILSDAEAEALDGCLNFFHGKLMVFEQICGNIYHKDAAVRQKDVIGLTRYLISQVSSRNEQELTFALKELGILLSMAADTFTTLIANTVQDTVGLFSKPTFTVQK